MKKSVLIIDDDVMTLRVLKKYLEDDYVVYMENSGFRVVDRLLENPVDLVLLDVEMPIINGIEVFYKIKENEKIKDIPVLFFSGVSNPTVVREVLSHGAAGYFVKSSSRTELLIKVESIIGDTKDASEAGNAETIDCLSKKNTILAIEQNSEILKKLKYACKDEYTFLFATNLFRALALLEKNDIDVCLLGKIQVLESKAELLEKIERVYPRHIEVIEIDEEGDVSELMEKVGRIFAE